MKIASLFLLFSLSASAFEFGFDYNVPLKERRVVRELMARIPGAIERRRAVSWQTPGVIRFAWVDGGNLSNPFGIFTEGDVTRGLQCVAWIYRGENTSINLNSAYRWNLADMRDVLEFEIDTALLR